MGFFEYSCDNCESIKEIFVGLRDKKDTIPCELCGNGMTRYFGNYKLTFKLNCAGFHNTDYQKEV
jgi:predicted nucleic acid-binding Zn ribbon protein